MRVALHTALKTKKALHGSTVVIYYYVLWPLLLTLVNPYSAGIDFRRQNLTSVDIRL